MISPGDVLLIECVSVVKVSGSGLCVGSVIVTPNPAARVSSAALKHS